LLSAHAPAYHALCRWLESVFGAWCERVTGRRGRVAVSASWYMANDYSTPHNDVGHRRHIAFVWHLARGAGGDGGWDERGGGDFVWCEPCARFAPSPNTLYLFRVHKGSQHFVQPVCELSDASTQKRLCVNGWYVLTEDESELGALGGADGRTLEARLSEEGYALHRELLVGVLSGAHTFVHWCDGAEGQESQNPFRGSEQGADGRVAHDVSDG